ncbi:hypothetical protein SGLAM104S_02037 [Streptomyces glaucescens]
MPAGHSVTAVTRRPDDFPLTHPALRVAGADVLDPARSAGPSPSNSTGLAPITRAMTEHGVSRPVAVTSTLLFGTDAPGEGLFSRKVGEPLVTRVPGRTVCAAVRRMEDAVRHTGRTWTARRPGGLFDTDTASDHRPATRRLPGRCTSRMPPAPTSPTPGSGTPPGNRTCTPSSAYAPPRTRPACSARRARKHWGSDRSRT